MDELASESHPVCTYVNCLFIENDLDSYAELLEAL